MERPAVAAAAAAVAAVAAVAVVAAVAAVAGHFEPVKEETASDFEQDWPWFWKFTDLKAKRSDKNYCSAKNNNLL
jgi:hypothetical protein